MPSFFLLALFLLSPRAHAYSYVEQELTPGGAYLSGGQTISLPLDHGVHQVQKLAIAAEGIRVDAMFEVVVNGVVKGTVHVPGSDPNYIVSVAEATRSIELHHLSGGTVRVRSVVATLSRECFPGHHDPIELPDLNFVTDKALELLSLYRQMEPFVSTEDRDNYLLPLRVSAGRLYAMASGHGDMSGKTRQALETMLDQMDASKEFWDRGFRNDDLFSLCVEALAIKERLAGAAE